MRQISEDRIKAYADRRFRSEYDYALFESYRSAKVIAFLERAGVVIAGRVLDAGCGGGGMPLSLAEHASEVIGIDPIDRFGHAGVTLSAERRLHNLHFLRADGMALPFKTGTFDLVLSHAVIEHVADAPKYLRECRRVLTAEGRFYLSTAPYLSFAGAHLPRLKVPLPLHLIVGRRIAFGTFRWLARHATWTLREPAHENSFIRDARLGIHKYDDLLEKVRVTRLRRQIAEAGLRIVREELHVTSTVRKLPPALGRWVRDSPLVQDALISNIEYVSGPREVMAEIGRYRPEDRRQVEALYRRVFGHDSADANRLRWDWQYRRNPNAPADSPLIWLAREGQTVVGQYAAMPVRLVVKGQEIDGAWGMDVMVAPERQRQGLGEDLFRTWDRAVGASLGLGLSEASARLFRKLRWPDVGPVPCLVKPLSRRALRRPSWPVGLNRLVSAVTLPWIRLVARAGPLQGEVRTVRQFDEGFTRLWDRVGGKFDVAVRRDAAYLNWKYVQAPHVRYSFAALVRDGDPAGYVIYRHLQEPRGRVTLLVDFLADPADEAGMLTLLRWIDREARAADSDKIRTFAMHEGFRRLLRKSGYYSVKSTMEFVAKINGVPLPATFYDATGGWHVTLGDSDQDR